MAEFNEVDATGEITEVQRETSVFRNEDTEDGKEETVVKIKLLEESISRQVPVEEREKDDAFQDELAETGAAHLDSDHDGKEERNKQEARKEKRRKRREKRRERERSKGSASDENDINQESSLQEKKAKIEGEEKQDVDPEKDPTEEERSETGAEGHVAYPSKLDGEAEGGESENGEEEPMEVQQETRFVLNLAESPFSLKIGAREPTTHENGTEEAEIEVVHSERKESAAREVKALLEAENMGGETWEPSKKNPEAEQRAQEERKRRADEVLATMNFENKREVKPDFQSDDTPAQESVEELFTVKEAAKKDGIHLQLILLSEDSNNGKTHDEEETNTSVEADKDAKFEELFSSENATEHKEDATEDGNPVEEVMVAQLQRAVRIQPPVWQLTEDGDGPDLLEGKEEPVALSEEEKETKLKELFEEEAPKEDAKQDESAEPAQAPAEEPQITAADSQLKVEAGVQDFSILDADKSATEPPQYGSHNDLEETELGFVSSSTDAREEETGETEPISEVQESVEEYVSLPKRKINICLETLWSTDHGEELPTNVASAEEAHGPSAKEPVKADMDSLFAFRPEQETKKEKAEDGREEVLDVIVMVQKTPGVSLQQFCLESFLEKPEQTDETEAQKVQIAPHIEKPDEAELEKMDEQHEQQRPVPVVPVGEEVKEEEIKDERKAAVNVEWDTSLFNEPPENDEKKPDEDEAEAEIGYKTLQDETMTTEAISRETHKTFTESKTIYTTSIVMKPISPTLKKPAPTFDTAGISGAESVTRSTVTTTLETIMVTKATTQDSTTGDSQRTTELLGPLPERESEGTAPLAQVEGTGLDAEDDLQESAEEGAKPGSEKESLIERVPKEEEPSKREAKAHGEEPEVETKEPEARDEEELIPEEKNKTKGKGTPKHRAKCCVLQ